MRSTSPCILVAVKLHFVTPVLRDLEALLPEGFMAAPAHATPDLDREIQRLLSGSHD